tara:strand:+ start:2961 stop:3287 length:327 start_codon:yes stop_codon:yes gene_type:complete
MIRVLSLKKIKNDICRINLIDFSNSLTLAASSSDGFINSKSYWLKNVNNEKKDINTITTISCWRSETDWNNWYTSKLRNKIEKTKIKNVEQHFFIMKEKNTNDDIFLL